MKIFSQSAPAAIEYVGLSGTTQECIDAILRLLQFGDQVTKAQILTNANTHSFLLTVNTGDLVAVKSGFASGYLGEGSAGFSYVLIVLKIHGAEIDEYLVSQELLDRLDNCVLTQGDIDMIENARPVRPSQWSCDYIFEKDWERKRQGTQWENFPPVIPYAIVDTRIADLALKFWKDPDETLMLGYRRLEDTIRRRTKLKEHGSKLFSSAFLGNNATLGWKDRDESVRSGKALLFTSTYQAYRNPRAHRELNHDREQLLTEFLLLNHLYMLESQAGKAKRRTSRKGANKQKSTAEKNLQKGSQPPQD